MKAIPLAAAMSSLIFSLGGFAVTPETFAAEDTATPPVSVRQFRETFAPGRILVKFKDTKPIPTSGPPSPGTTMGGLRIGSAAESTMAAIDGKVDMTFANLGIVRIATEQNVGRAIETLYRSGTVIHAEPDYMVHIDAVPNDPSFSLLWGMHNSGQTGGTVDADIDAPEAWNARITANNVVVAVIDSGVDYTHPDLAANMWKNPNEIAGNGIDDDGNGYVDDVYGLDAWDHDSDPMDGHGHGTHVSGTIGARGKNGNGIAGVAWQTQIMALRFLNSSGSGYTSGAVELIEYAIAIKAANNYKAMVLNNSWGGGAYAQTLHDAIEAAGNAGILFVAAAGNNATNTDLYDHYPASYDLPNIISVGASDKNDLPASFTNYGCASVDVFAPGVGIYSTLPNNSYASWNGTSMATPHVAGAAALIWAKDPNQSWKKIKRAILNGADTKADNLNDLAGTESRLNLRGGLNPTYMKQPSIWGVSSTSASPGGTVTITGSRFGVANGTVLFNDQPLTVDSWSDETIVATVPSGITIGNGLLKVANEIGVQNRNGRCFSVSYKTALAGKTLLPHAWAAGAKVDGDYWIMGGGTTWGQTGLVERYTPASQRSVIDSGWMMPTPVTNAGSAAIGAKVYVVGGADWNTGEFFDTLQIFDTATGAWSAGPNLPVKLAQPAVAALPNGKLYVFGGMDALGTILNTTYIYNPSNNTWNNGAPMPRAQAYGTAIAQGTYDMVMVAGGYDAPYLGAELNTVQLYRAETDSWSLKSAMKAHRAGASGMYYKNLNHVLFGGDVTNRSDGEWFKTGAWTNNIQGSQALRAQAGVGAAFDDGAYAFGGFDDASDAYTNNVWKLTR